MGDDLKLHRRGSGSPDLCDFEFDLQRGHWRKGWRKGGTPGQLEAGVLKTGYPQEGLANLDLVSHCAKALNFKETCFEEETENGEVFEIGKFQYPCMKFLFRLTKGMVVLPHMSI